VKPIPVVFHLGPLQIHTYGIGLALTFWFAYRYFAKRLATTGIPMPGSHARSIWIVIASVIGARAVHVVANLRGAQGYAQNPRGHPRHLAWRPVELRRTARRGAHRADLRATLVSPAPPWRGS